MKPNPAPRRSLHVTVAAAVVVALAGLLVARLLPAPTATADTSPVAPDATVPRPGSPPADGVEMPCWGCQEAREWPLRFRTDLDLLAPLGTGTANAAVWFAQFEKERGPRHAEARAAMERRVNDPRLGQLLRLDEPLLAEAEPWCDQARMSFYPDVFPLEGYATRITDLLLPLAMAKTWVARGNASADEAAAMADYRRAIRLGRLLRQEDAVIITDLVGLACIRYGLEGIYDRARDRGDLALALLAGTALGEHAPQRLLTAARLTEVDSAPGARRGADGRVALNLDDGKLGRIIAAARSAPDRRFRAEAIVSLNLILYLAPREQRTRAREALETLAGDADPIVATTAVWSRDTEPSEAMLAVAFPDLGL